MSKYDNLFYQVKGDSTMEVFGHQISFYGALIKNGLSHEEALSMIREHGAKLMLVDNLRAVVTGEGVAKFGRGYSHFTDDCGMVLPFGDALKNYTSIQQTTFVHEEGYVNKFADKPTDFAKFIRMNPAMFLPENQDWGICTLAHLQQDVGSDDVWQRKVCVCDTDNDYVRYNYTGFETNGGQFRKDMAKANIYMHVMFVGYVRNVLQQKIQQEEFLEAIFESVDRWYTPEMAAATKKYFDLDPRIFTLEHEELKELAAEICATKMFKTRKQLDMASISLFEESMVSLNPVVNHLVHMK